MPIYDIQHPNGKIYSIEAGPDANEQDLFNTVEQYDRVILFSGDGDFERAIELLRSKNTHITVVSTEGMIARELRNATDRYIDLNDIRDSIEKVDS